MYLREAPLSPHAEARVMRGFFSGGSGSFHRRTALWPASFLLVFSVGLPAQTLGPFRGTLPAGYEWIEGSGRTFIPFGMAKGICQQSWGIRHVPDGRPLQVIRALSIRRDRTGKRAGAFWVDCEMGFSTTVKPPGKPSAVFAANRGKDFIVVFTRKRLSFPASAPRGKPSAWLPPIPLDRPFAFLRANAAGLLWETRVYGASSGSPGPAFTMDGMGPGLSIMPPRGKSAGGCPAVPSGAPLSCTASVLAKVGGYMFTARVDHVPPGGAVFLFLGRRSWRFGFLPLPFDLAPLGAPGCKVYVDYLAHLGGKAGSTGTAAFKLSLPRGLPGGTPIYAQGFVPSSRANPLGLAASNGACAMTLGVPRQAVVYNTSSPAAQTGTVRRLQGVILAMDYF